ncbi:MAG TPA: DUF4493 domain-containing protein [Candidatus Coprenecus avistercoris]|uniref:DUF4493 domain-containing protein n=1 Tax=Candidatus Coprenecus avistercoris TaxID=2840730 RepID=A0A9D1J6P2_9BACT|nr:DUF4493 domain-containing protein [Candidatus Coprenecus avistercoris]
MNRSIRYIIMTAIAVLSLLSCNRKEDSLLVARGEGLLSLDLGFEPGLTVTTRAGEGTGDLKFKIEVLNSKGTIVQTVEDHTSLEDSPISLRAGHYTVRASHGQNVEAAFNSPYYAGETEVDIVIGQTATASIECALANVKVSVEVSDVVKEKFSSYSVTVSNGAADGSLTFGASNLDNSGYFRCPADGILDYVVNITNTDGDSYTIEQNINGVKPRDHYIISLDVNPDVTTSAAVALRITVDNTVNEQDHDMDLNLNKPARPALTEAGGADISGPMRAPQGVGKTGLFNLESKGGVQRVVLTHSSDEIAALGIPNKLNLQEAGEDVRTAAAEKGLTWADFETGVTSVNGLLDIRTMLAYNLPLGTYQLTLSVLDQYAQRVDFLLTLNVTPAVEVSVEKVNAWARSAYVHSVFYTESQPEGMALQYRRKGDASWTQFSGDFDVEGTAFTARITGLEPAVTYEVMPYTALEQNETSIFEFTTEEAAQLPNFNFDTWSDNGHFPNAEGSAFWDSGNQGASTLGKYPTSQETGHVVSGSAAKLESQFVGIGSLGKFAGGNIYSGTFVELVGMNGAIIDFGRPYTSRPSALKGWYSYAPVVIDYVDGSHGNLKGVSDTCQIYVALTDAPYRVNNAEGILFNPDDPSVIAYGTMVDGAGTGGEYREFTINLEYRDLDRKPTHVIVVAASSKYADYFTGGNGSTMYIDEFQFLFE